MGSQKTYNSAQDRITLFGMTIYRQVLCNKKYKYNRFLVEILFPYHKERLLFFNFATIFVWVYSDVHNYQTSQNELIVPVMYKLKKTYINPNHIVGKIYKKIANEKK